MTFRVNRVFSIFAVAIALGTAAPTLVLVAPATAQSRVAQTPSSKPQRNPLNLTEQQRQQMQAIRQNTQQQIAAILTPEQRRLVEQARQSGQKPRGLMQSLNLTQEQKTQIKAIREQSQEQIKALLTPEQLQQWESRKGNRQRRAR